MDSSLKNQLTNHQNSLDELSNFHNDLNDRLNDLNNHINELRSYNHFQFNEHSIIIQLVENFYKGLIFTHRFNPLFKSEFIVVDAYGVRDVDINKFFRALKNCDSFKTKIFNLVSAVEPDSFENIEKCFIRATKCPGPKFENCIEHINSVEFDFNLKEYFEYISKNSNNFKIFHNELTFLKKMFENLIQVKN